VEVGGWEELRLLGLGPEFLLEKLTLWAVTIPTRVIGRPRIATMVADLEMSPELGGATRQEGTDGPSLITIQVHGVRVIA
jgi:hypothetical protein